MCSLPNAVIPYLVLTLRRDRDEKELSGCLLGNTAQSLSLANTCCVERGPALTVEVTLTTRTTLSLNYQVHWNQKKQRTENKVQDIGMVEIKIMDRCRQGCANVIMNYVYNSHPAVENPTSGTEEVFKNMKGENILILKKN